jgi:hypothetical protein
MLTTIYHEFLAIDEGNGTLLRIDETEPGRNWVVDLPWPQSRDMQLIGEGRVLIGHQFGYAEFEIATGRVVREVKSLEGVTSVRRLSDGTTRVAGVNLAGAAGVTLIELDRLDSIVQHHVLAGDYVRLIRQTAVDTLLLMCSTCIRETGLDGIVRRELTVEGFQHAWKAVRRSNGNILASASYVLGSWVPWSRLITADKDIYERRSFHSALFASLFCSSLGRMSRFQLFQRFHALFRSELRRSLQVGDGCRPIGREPREQNFVHRLRTESVVENPFSPSDRARRFAIHEVVLGRDGFHRLIEIRLMFGFQHPAACRFRIGFDPFGNRLPHCE